MQKPLPLFIWLLLIYPAWLLFQAVHELGHALHAFLAGGRGISVELPLVGFSRTVVATNPNPLLVIWGGVVWGSAIPLALWLVGPRQLTRVRRVLQAFAGFCLIGNGAYLAVGWIDRVGDAGDLMRHGTPTWLLIAAGAPAIVCGLWLWHRLAATAANRKRADVE